MLSKILLELFPKESSITLFQSAPLLVDSFLNNTNLINQLT